ncbi:hypothetical protein BH23BAC1_BH23BAC1_41400 [soil metagenome]
MKKIFFCLFFSIICGTHLSFSQKVKIHFEKSIPQAVYAAERLDKSLQENGYIPDEEQPEYRIHLAIDSQNLDSESYLISSEGNKLTVTGGDERGLIYGSLSLVEDLGNRIQLQQVKSRSESANLPFRALKFNLPWDSYRHSEALDLHTETCKNLDFWKEFLDMMAENRFNALTLWNLHPFTFMIKPKNFTEASPFSDQEMEEWQNLYSNIFRMARERSIDSYIVNWNIYVSPEFSKAHNVAMDNLEHNIHAIGDTSEIVKRYTRESVTQVLEEYPDLSGIGFTHGEGMGGMTPQQRQDWFQETIIEGMRLANRKSKLIHRVPLSANLATGGSTSIDTEQITRKAMEKLDFFDGPIWVEIKFNWSHAHSSPELIKVHGGKLNDTYFKPEPENYKIAWMARNEDFFCLRWGVPDFIRQHIATNTQSYVGGYFVGSECYIPAKDYFTKTDAPVNWRYAFQRQWLFYKLWGRLLYDPDTPDETFKAEFVRRYGKEADNLLEAYALASSTPLRLASSFDFTWDFTLYSEGFSALYEGKTQYISVDRQINQPPADPNYVSVIEYVKAGSSGSNFSKDKITPPILARKLEQDCQKALSLVRNFKTENNPSLIYEVADVKAWANLGLYFAEKLKGAVALQTYRIKGEEANKQNAINHLEKALQYWDEVIEITGPIYNDMPLTHYSEEDDSRRFHWEILRSEVARDVDIAKNAKINSGN